MEENMNPYLSVAMFLMLGLIMFLHGELKATRTELWKKVAENRALKEAERRARQKE